MAAIMVGVSPVITEYPGTGIAPPAPHYMFDWHWDDTIIYLVILF